MPPLHPVHTVALPWHNPLQVYEHDPEIHVGVVAVFAASMYPTIQLHALGVTVCVLNWLLSHDVQLFADASKSQSKQVAWQAC